MFINQGGGSRGNEIILNDGTAKSFNPSLIHLTAGRGPAECELAVGLFRSVCEQEISIEVLAEEKGRYAGCFKSVLFRTDNTENIRQGTIQWICKSPFRPNHKRKNWFIGINQINEPKGSVYETGNPGVIFQTFRAGGKGGQHVNKTESAVRAIHVATGLMAIACDERSQYQNRKLALERLLTLIEKNKNDIQSESDSKLFMNHNSLERGNPVRIYEGMSFRRIE